MKKSWWLILHYLVAGEESRIGRKDYWDIVFWLNTTPLQRRCLAFSKVFFILMLSAGIMMLLANI